MKNKISKDELYQIEIDVKRYLNTDDVPLLIQRCDDIESDHEDDVSSQHTIAIETSPDPETEQDDITKEQREFEELVTKYEEEIIVQYEENLNIKLFDRPQPGRLEYNRENKEKMLAANAALAKIIEIYTDLDCATLNTLYYATATVVAGPKEIFDTTPKVKPDKDWKVKKDIERIRSKIGKLTDYCKTPTVRKKEKLVHILKAKDAETVLQEQRMMLAARCKSLRTKNSKKERFINNRMFRERQKTFYSKLRGDSTHTITNPPTKEKLNKFWGGILGDKKEHNGNAGWLKAEYEAMEKVPEHTWNKLNVDQVRKKVKETKNWKAPGIDGVQNYWLKHLTTLHPMLTEVINSIIQEPDSAPEWMTEGKTTLVFKKGEENEAKNYRPITCLPTIYKLLTLIITESIYTHITDNDILPYEQKGCRRKARGCKEHLILDRNILETAKKNKRNVSIL